VARTVTAKKRRDNLQDICAQQVEAYFRRFFFVVPHQPQRRGCLKTTPLFYFSGVLSSFGVEDANAENNG
jgi:hypothetical protein